MGIEFEVKFSTTPRQQADLREAFSGQEQVIRMATTYYDTAEKDLSARRCTLRRRLENGRSVCTLKLPADGYGKEEIEVCCDSVGEAAKELAAKCRDAFVRQSLQKALLPICGAEFTRIAKTVALPACTVELALDRGVLTGGGRTEGLCEAEVELKSGSREAMLSFAERIAQEHSLEQEKRSKFRRALALAEGADNGTI